MEYRAHYFESTWERFSPVDERLMLRLAEDGPCPFEALEVPEAGRDEKRALRDALGGLVEKHLVKKSESGYAVTYPLMRKWIFAEMLDYDLNELMEDQG